MTKPIALQLYTVREELAKDFEGTIRRLAAMGYVGVETAGSPEGVTAVQAKALFDEVGLTVCAAHMPLPLGDDKNKLLDVMDDLGCKKMVSAWLPPDEYKTRTSIDRVCERLNEAAAAAAERGITLGVHNHWWEFELNDGVRPYQLWLEQLDPAIFFELDTYWVHVGGVDPVTALAEMGDRAQLLHVKDGPADNSKSDMTAVGTGKMDYTTIIPAAAAAEWMVVELDRCATDMMTAVQESYTYLTQKGLAHGKQ